MVAIVTASILPYSFACLIHHPSYVSPFSPFLSPSLSPSSNVTIPLIHLHYPHQPTYLPPRHRHPLATLLPLVPCIPYPLFRHGVNRYQTAISITTTANYRTKPGDEFTGRSTCFMQFVGRRSEYWDAARRREDKRAHSDGSSLSATIVAAIWHATRKKHTVSYI